MENSANKQGTKNYLGSVVRYSLPLQYQKKLLKTEMEFALNYTNSPVYEPTNPLELELQSTLLKVKEELENLHPGFEVKIECKAFLREFVDNPFLESKDITNQL